MNLKINLNFLNQYERNWQRKKRKKNGHFLKNIFFSKQTNVFHMKKQIFIKKIEIKNKEIKFEKKKKIWIEFNKET